MEKLALEGWMQAQFWLIDHNNPAFAPPASQFPDQKQKLLFPRR
jgi:hypothetical protein